MRGVTAGPRPDRLKVAVGSLAGFVGEGEISYAGPGCLARADLAIEIVEKRLRDAGIGPGQLQFARIGVDAVRRGEPSGPFPAPPEVRIRVAGRVNCEADAERIGREVTALWLNGPAGGGGARRTVTEQIAIRSTTIPRAAVRPRVEWVEV